MTDLRKKVETWTVLLQQKHNMGFQLLYEAMTSLQRLYTPTIMKPDKVAISEYVTLAASNTSPPRHTISWQQSQQL
jgi:hypothetical protein